jgi:hypothetical protein
MPLVDVIRELIILREWLGHMSLSHANVQIRNDSARTTYIIMLVESRRLLILGRCICSCCCGAARARARLLTPLFNYKPEFHVGVRHH